MVTMSTTTVQRSGGSDGDWLSGCSAAPGQPPAGGGSPLANACWLALDALAVPVVAALQALWGPSPLLCARAGVYVFNAIDAAGSAGCWLAANERWYNRTGTQVLPKPRARTGVVKWMSDRLDPWQ